jgi:hypothetical protein
VRAGRRAEIIDPRRQLLAIPAILDAAVGSCEASVGVVGSRSLCEHDDLRPFLPSAARDVEATPGDRFGDRLLQNVRRLPSVDMREGRGSDRFTRSTGTAPATAGMDRVDALLAIFDATPAPRSAALLASARNLTGRILRSPESILRLLQELTPPPVQRAAIVALGLLVSPAPNVYVMTADPLDVAAVLLNAILAAPHSAAELAARLELTLGGRAGSLAAAARIRCELGRYLTAVG